MEEKKQPTEKEIQESRKKFAEKYGHTQIGGKGTEKRKHPVKHRGNKVEVDKKIEAVAKKSQARKLNEIVEVNIFKDDNTVIQFKKPTVEYSFKEKVTFISGNHETKQLKDVFTSLVKQLGPKQLAYVKESTDPKKDEKEKEKIDEAPELVEDFEEAAEKGKEKKKKKKAKKDKKEDKKDDKKEDKKEGETKEGESKEEPKEGETKEEPKELETPNK